MRFFISCCFLVVSTFSYAGGETTSVGAKQQAMGKTSTTYINVFAAFNNIANTAFLQSTQLGLYAENRFLQSNINAFNLAFTYKNSKLGAFSLTSHFYGYSLYNETEIGLGYAKNFGNKISAGLKFNYYRLAIAENGSKSLVSFNLGLLYKPLDKFHIGFTVYNPIKMKLEKVFKETLSTEFKLGLAYLPTNKFEISLEGQKDLINPFQVRLGFNYDVHKYLSLRVGGATQPILFTFGVGTHIKNLQIDFSSVWDINLGYSPQLSLHYTFKNNVKE